MPIWIQAGQVMIDGPVFAIGESSGLLVFSSAAAAEAEIETVDIEDEEERARFFDSEGIELLPEVVEPVGRWNSGRWRLLRPRVAEQHRDVLRGSLILSLTRVGYERTGALPAELQRMELPRLVELISPYADS